MVTDRGLAKIDELLETVEPTSERQVLLVTVGGVAVIGELLVTTVETIGGGLEETIAIPADEMTVGEIKNINCLSYSNCLFDFQSLSTWKGFLSKLIGFILNYQLNIQLLNLIYKLYALVPFTLSLTTYSKKRERIVYEN